MKFGNGGTVIDLKLVMLSTSPTNTDTKLGDSYNETYTKIVDVDDPNTDTNNNKVEIPTFAGQNSILRDCYSNIRL